MRVCVFRILTESSIPSVWWCDGPLEAHHCIPKQTIKGQYSYWHGLMDEVRVAKGMPETLPLLEAALADRRNLIPLCRRHHELVSNRRLYVGRDMLPEGIDEFAAETGLSWYMERYFDRQDAA